MPTRLLVASVLLTLVNATGAFADAAPTTACPPKPCCEPVCCPPMPDDCCTRNVCPPTGVITPRVDLIKGQGMDWFVTGDYTFWTAREDNIEFAASTTPQGINATQSATTGKAYRPDNKWVSGFKVGLGTDFCHDGWDVYAEYTWFKSTKNNDQPSGFPTVINPNNPFGVPVLVDLYWGIDFAGGNNNTYSSAAATWRLKMNVVDLELGRNFYVSRRLMIRPFCGFKGAWNKQRMNVDFVGINTSPPPIVITPIEVSMLNEIKNWGIGARAGADTAWHFTKSFSVVADLAFTGLWEEFKVNRFDTTSSGGVVQDSNIDISEKQYAVKPIIEWTIGLKWETGLSCDAYHLSIAAGWEEQVWFGQNKFFRAPGNSVGSGGDLSLQGLTVDVRFDF